MFQTKTCFSQSVHTAAESVPMLSFETAMTRRHNEDNASAMVEESHHPPIATQTSSEKSFPEAASLRISGCHCTPKAKL